MSVVSQLWQTPVRHDQRTGTSHASANSSTLAKSLLHGIERLLRANSIVGPLPGAPEGGCGDRAGIEAMPGVREERRVEAYSTLKRRYALLREEHEILKKAIRFCSAQRQQSSRSSKRNGTDLG